MTHAHDAESDGPEPESSGWRPSPQVAPHEEDADTRRRRFEPKSLLFVAPWLILAAVPVIAAYRAVQGRWTPVSDWAMIGAWTWDSTSWPPPLLGMPTSLSHHTGPPLQHPGPLLFWALALPTRLLGAPGYGLVIGSAIINIVCLVVIALGLRAIGGRFLSLAGAVAVGIMMMALGADAWRNPFNPIIAMLPLLSFLVAAAAFVAGKHRWLIAVIGAGSFAAQAHVSVLVIVGVVLIVVIAQIATGMFFDRPNQARPSAKVLGASLVAGLVCWSGPLYDQFFSTGNLWGLLSGGSGASGPRFGLRYGFDRLIDAVTVPPWWWTGVPGGELDHPGTVQVVLGTALLLLGAALLVVGWRRDRAVAGTLAIAFAAVIAATIASSLVPIDPLSVESNTNRFLWLPTGLFFWVTVGHGCARLLIAPAIRPVEQHRVHTVGTAAAVLATPMVLLAAIVGVSGSGPKHGIGSAMFGAVREHSQALAGLDAPNGFLLMTDDDEIPSTILLQGVVGQLAFADVHIGIPTDLDSYDVFTSYQRRHPPSGREDAIVVIRNGAAADVAPPGFCLASRYDPAHPWPVYEGYDETFFLVGGAPSAAYLGAVPAEGETVASPEQNARVLALCEQATAGRET